MRRIKNYRQNTGLEGSPVLLTYQPSVVINRIIAETIARKDSTSLSNHEAVHMLWKIEDETILSELAAAFAQVKEVYLADGHHRFESAVKLAAEQRANGEQVFSNISSLYMAADQLRIQEFDRIVLPSSHISKTDLLVKVSERFEVVKSDVTTPLQQNHIGMFAGGEWFDLVPRFVPKGNFASQLDAAILQEQLLAPVFGITDPVKDTRLKCIGGAGALDEIKALLAEHTQAVAFKLAPLSVEQLIMVADAGEILPPKSTWIDPKVPYGLLLYHHKFC